MSNNSIGVLVRVRPLLKREPNIDSLVEMPMAAKTNSNTVVLHGKEVDADWRGKRPLPDKTFQFDQAIWSFDNADGRGVNNSKLYKTTGPRLIDHYFEGYNVCLLAYGQTGSGKTHTMMGDSEDPGIIPLLVKDIFEYKTRLVADKVNCQVKVSYFEIYNEKVQDLLYEGPEKQWKVREHPEKGPYVEGLEEHTIESVEGFTHYLNKGNAKRATGSTSMNERSSRSHAIINIHLKQTRFGDSTNSKDSIGDASTEVESHIKLVDLAGSERFNKTGVYGQQDRIKEGTLINKSLAVLGRCINGLSKNISTGSTDRIPYRDSSLTYILKENLGGNSQTMMIFCIAPLDYDETLQTLNYATRVKQIKTRARASEVKISDVKMEWQADSVDSLKKEIEELSRRLEKSQLELGTGHLEHQKGHLEPEQPEKSQAEKETKASSLVNYLDKQLQKAEFQNTYLQSKLALEQEKTRELTNHNQYLHSLLVQQFESQHKTQLMVQQNQKVHTLETVAVQLKSHQKDLLRYLCEFDPRSVI